MSSEAPDILDKIRAMYEKLSRFYWSPQHPAAYTIEHPSNGRAAGLGLLAMQSPAAFNLAYIAVGGKLDTLDDHIHAVTLFTGYRNLVEEEVNKQPLSSWILLMSAREFKNWIANDENCAELSDAGRQQLWGAINYLQLQQLQADRHLPDVL